MNIINKAKISISLKIALLAVFAFIISEIVSSVTGFQEAELCVLISIYIFTMSLIFFAFSFIHDVLGENASFFTSILVLLYITFAIFFLYYLIRLSFIAEFEIIPYVLNIAWKVFVCFDGIVIFCKVATLLFGKKSIKDESQNDDKQKCNNETIPTENDK